MVKTIVEDCEGKIHTIMADDEQKDLMGEKDTMREKMMVLF